jgi:carbonic anhydrase
MKDIASGVAFVTCSELSQLSVFPYEPSKSVSVWQNLGGCLDDPLLFAETVLSNKISNIVVLGHYPCALLELALNWDPLAVKMSKKTLEEAAARVSELRASIDNKFGLSRNAEVMRKASEEHVICQLSKVAALLPEIESRSGRTIRLHGWLLVDEELRCLDPERRQFVSVRDIAYSVP